MTQRLRAFAIVAFAAVASAGAAHAQRLVALAPFLTEAVYAVGAGDKLVAVSEFSDYPPAAKALPTVSNAIGVSWEKLAVLKPDVILAWGDMVKEGDRERFARVGAKLVVFPGRRLDDIPKMLREVSALAGLGKDPPAASEFEARIATLREANKGRPPVMAFLEIQHRPLMTIAGGHYMSDALEVCGARNVFEDLPGVAPVVPWEALLARDPAVIVSAGAPGNEGAFRDRWKEYATLSAMRANALVYLDGDRFHRPTPRFADAIEDLCGKLGKLRR